MARLTQPPGTARTWNSSRPSVARRVRRGEVAPQPRALRGLDADVLPGPVGDGLARRDLDDREVPADPAVPDDPAQPGRRPALGARRRPHRRGDRAVGAGPRLLDLRGPGRPGELRDGAEQRDADGVVVLGEHTELAVVAAELLEERHELVRAVHHLHDVHQRAQQAAALHLHVHREQVAGLGSVAEQRRVEVPRDLLRARGRRPRSWSG